MTPGIRHVLAAAVRCRAEVIVTYNKRHFPSAALECWGVEAQAPSTFLKHLYQINPTIVVDRLEAQARNLGRSLPQLLSVLMPAASTFVDALCQDVKIKLDS
jgi:hypothetical protein